MQDGLTTGTINEPGGFVFSSDDINSQSIFVGGGPTVSLTKSTWRKFGFGGQVGSEQLAFYANLKEISKNRFDTQSEMYWDDAFFGTQVGAVTRGTYALKIVDPLLLVKNFIPQKYLVTNAPAFDFADMGDEAAEKLFNEVTSSLSATFSNYTNNPSKGDRIDEIQEDQIGLTKSLPSAVEDGYQWRSTRRLEVVRTAILAIEYDEDTKVLMSDVKEADALPGSHGNPFFQQAAAGEMQSADKNGGGANMVFVGMGINAVGNTMGATQ